MAKSGHQEHHRLDAQPFGLLGSRVDKQLATWTMGQSLRLAASSLDYWPKPSVMDYWQLLGQVANSMQLPSFLQLPWTNSQTRASPVGLTEANNGGRSASLLG